MHDNSSRQSGPRPRIETIDLARGIAVALMILSHGIKGLLSFEQFPDWGLVPIHLVTKISSSLFFIVFGVALAVAFVPHVQSDSWPAKQRRLVFRGLIILFWYKILTIVEMFHLYSREQILNTLLYKNFAIYSEILGFYAIALLWIPFALKSWVRTPLLVKIILPGAFAYLAHYLQSSFDFWGNDVVKALFVEHDKFYTWGQISRLPLILMGLLIGEALTKSILQGGSWRKALISGLFFGSLLGFGLFYYLCQGQVYESLLAISYNDGKHPPELVFMLFSIAGALLILALTLLGGNYWASVLRPITIIGSDALNSFIFHLFVLFVFYRFLFDFWQKVTYNEAMLLTIGLIAGTPVWIKLRNWVTKKQ